MVSAEKAAKLEALRNRATRYELVLEKAGAAERLRLCYTSKKNRTGLMAAIRNNGPELVALTGASDFKITREPSALLGAWRVFFSGRTQRDCIVSDSELRWFAAGDSSRIE